MAFLYVESPADCTRPLYPYPLPDDSKKNIVKAVGLVALIVLGVAFVLALGYSCGAGIPFTAVPLTLFTTPLKYLAVSVLSGFAIAAPIGFIAAKLSK